MTTILVVEDSKAEQRLVSGVLRGVGFNVAVAETATLAITWLTDHGQPDLILMDIVMPDLSGFDLCRKIRQELHYDSVPIVFCSHKNQEFDRFWALRQGGNAYIMKPYSPMDLVKTVKEHLMTS